MAFRLQIKLRTSLFLAAGLYFQWTACLEYVNQIMRRCNTSRIFSEVIDNVNRRETSRKHLSIIILLLLLFRLHFFETISQHSQQVIIKHLVLGFLRSYHCLRQWMQFNFGGFPPFWSPYEQTCRVRNSNGILSLVTSSQQREGTACLVFNRFMSDRTRHWYMGRISSHLPYRLSLIRTSSSAIRFIDAIKCELTVSVSVHYSSVMCLSIYLATLKCLLLFVTTGLLATW